MYLWKKNLAALMICAALVIGLLPGISLMASAETGGETAFAGMIPAKLTGISFPKKEYSLKKGKTLDLAAKLKRTPEGATAKFTWESSDETVATVDKNGLVTALKKGTATITVTTKTGLGAKVKIKVKNK